DGSEEKAYPVLKRATLIVEDGDHVELGQPFLQGTLDPKDILQVGSTENGKHIPGERAVQKYLVEGVQGVYRSPCVPIHDNHIWVTVRPMLRNVTVVDHGGTELLPGELVVRARSQRNSREARVDGKRAATARPEVMGITKASLAA